MFHRPFGQLSGALQAGVLVLAGPTASGKTALAVDLARSFNAEIINADSRQIYRDMEIGTAAPTPEQRVQAPHHLFSFLDPQERYSAARFTEDAVSIIEDIHARGKRAIVAGGTGFYVRALTGGVDLAAAYDPALRARLAHEGRLHDTEFLYEWLRVRNPVRAQALARGDAYRILRALEIALAAPDATAREVPLRTLPGAGIAFLKVFLRIDPAVLERRIEQRTDAMLRSGLIEEAERVGDGAVAADAVGYPQALAFLNGRCTYDELRTLLLRATRRYAKRQISWFRREPQTLEMEASLVAAAAREKLGWV